MSEEYGVKELRELVDFVLSLVDDMAKSVEDGKLSAGDMLNFYQCMQMAGPAMAGVGEVGNELRDLSDSERGELNAHIAQKLDLKNDRVEGYVEASLQVALLLAGLMPKKEKSE